jgi:Mrp family chromosome partitioning ATPase
MILKDIFTQLKSINDLKIVPTKAILNSKLHTVVKENPSKSPLLREYKDFITDIFSLSIDSDDTAEQLVQEFSKNRAVIISIDSVRSLADEGKYGEAIEVLSEAAEEQSLQVDETKITDLLTTITDRKTLYGPDGLRRIETPFSKLTKMLKGGFREGYQYVFVGPTNVGKTTLVLNFALHAVKMGYLVYHLSAETFIEELLMRLDSMVLDVSEEVIKEDLDYYLPKIHDFWKSVKGKFLLQYVVSGTKEISMIEKQFSSIVKTYGKLPDLLIIDYPEKMKPSTALKDYRFQVAGLYADARRIAELYHIPEVVVCQTSAVGWDNPRPRLQMTSEAKKIIMEAPVGIVIAQTPEDKQRTPTRTKLWVDKNKGPLSDKEGPIYLEGNPETGKLWESPAWDFVGLAEVEVYSSKKEKKKEFGY